MKWITHQTGAALAALALDLPGTGILMAIIGSVMPDVIDQRVSGLARKKRQKVFNKIHRGDSHWFGWWLAPLLFALYYPMPPYCRDLLAGIAFGGLSHIVLDMLTIKGTPLLPFSRRFNISFKLCSTGKISEYIFFAAMCGAALIFFSQNFTDLYQRIIPAVTAFAQQVF